MQIPNQLISFVSASHFSTTSSFNLIQSAFTSSSFQFTDKEWTNILLQSSNAGNREKTDKYRDTKTDFPLIKLVT